MTVYILCVYISYMCKYELGQHYLLLLEIRQIMMANEINSNKESQNIIIYIHF